jgi:hypothetical protein
MHQMPTDEFLAHVEARIENDYPLTATEHDAMMSELVRRAQDLMPPLAFHAWSATSFALRHGMVGEAELEAMGDDIYVVLFELDKRGVLDAMQQAIASGESAP